MTATATNWAEVKARIMRDYNAKHRFAAGTLLHTHQSHIRLVVVNDEIWLDEDNHYVRPWPVKAHPAEGCER